MTEMSGVIRSIDRKIQALDRKQVSIAKHMIELHRKEERLTLARLMRREFLKSPFRVKTRTTCF